VEGCRQKIEASCCFKKSRVISIIEVFDAFHNATDAQRTFREVMFLQELNGTSAIHLGH
jgi:hypothetical protein